MAWQQGMLRHAHSALPTAGAAAFGPGFNNCSTEESPQGGAISSSQHGPIRVYVMLPLDTVDASGAFKYATSSWFCQALQLLAASGVYGVAVDVWWGAVERAPRMWNWTGYHQLIGAIKQTGLKVQAVLSFHACGGNVNDTATVPLPSWVLQAGEQDPDLFFTDRPRENGLGQRNREYVSIWADDAPGALCGRTPMQCYEDFMMSFRDHFAQDLGPCIEEIVLGAGPCGELRYPSYAEPNGWRFPGIGEFQCYDRRALASLAQAAREAGHPQWGYGGPHDAGDYNSVPEETGFFSYEGSWDSPYGRFFLNWYATSLLRHGERLLSIASHVFGSQLLKRLSVQNSGGTGDSSGSEASGAIVVVGGLGGQGSGPARAGAATVVAGSATQGSGSPTDTPVQVGTTVGATASGSLRSTVTSYGATLSNLCATPAAGPPAGTRSLVPSDTGIMDVDGTWDTAELVVGLGGASPAGARPNSTGMGSMTLTEAGLGGGLQMRPPSMTLVGSGGGSGGAGSIVVLPTGVHSTGMGRFMSSSTIADSAADMIALMPSTGRGESGGGAALGGAVMGGGAAICNSVSSLSTECAALHTGGGPFATPYVDMGALVSRDGDDGGSDMGGSCMTPDTLGVEEGLVDAAAARVPTTNAFAVASAVAAACEHDLYAEADARRRSSLDASTAHVVGGGQHGSRGRDGAGGITLALKIAGIHWWFRSRSHAAELTAGYYNTANHDGYAPILELCSRYRAALILTCVEMCDGQHPAGALCGPEGLLKQIRSLAARTQVKLSGENALPILLTDCVDTVALDRILFNTRAWYGPGSLIVRAQTAAHPLPYQHQYQAIGHMASSSVGGSRGPVRLVSGSAPSSVLPSPVGTGQHGRATFSSAGSHGIGAVGSAQQLCGMSCLERSLSDAGKCVMGLGRPGDQHGIAASGLRTDSYADIVEPLPAMRSFTFLRLAPELLQPSFQAPWLRFMCRMQQGGYAPG